jgi:hypothetical protein
MIHQVLSNIAKEMNSYFRLRFGLQEDKVILSSLVSPDGKLVPNLENMVILTLVNMPEESSGKGKNGPSNYVRTSQGAIARVNPPVNLNLYVLFSAFFPARNYEESLKFISGVVGFFQGKRVFSPQNSPWMDSRMDKLSVEIVNLELQEMNNLWNVLGAKYLPSMVYRIRSLSIQEGQIREEITQIEGLSPDTR